jgi:hypothetical protein
MTGFRLDEARGFVRLAFGLRRFLAHRVAIDGADELIRVGVADRETRFLAKLRSAVFGHAPSPYRTLCRWAGVEFGDIEVLVRSDGLEAALARLRDAGVRVEWEELKGRKPIVRGSQTLAVPWHSFDNPLARTDFAGSTGGSSGRSLRVSVDLENCAESAPGWALVFAAHRWQASPLIFWTPNHVGVASRFLKCSRFGKDMARWFVMARITDRGERLRSAVIHSLVRTVAGYPAPTDAPLDAAGPVLDDLYGWLDRGSRPVVNTSPSAAALLSTLAAARGRPLSGVSFLLGAEPLTRARHQAIVAGGGSAVATYGTSEAGWIGAQLPGARQPDEVHVFKDAYAVVIQPHGAASEGGALPLLFTNLQWSSPKLLLNAEIGDCGNLEVDAADPWAGSVGYDTRLRTIRSFRKVTLWGTTFAVADLEGLVEAWLPARFGGSHAQWQLWETEDGHGRPELRLLADPAIGPLEETAVAEALLAELARRGRSYGFMADELRSTGSLKVERRGPRLTGRGKLLPVLTQRAN